MRDKIWKALLLTYFEIFVVMMGPFACIIGAAWLMVDASAYQEKITLGTPETTLTNTYEPMLLTIVSDDPATVGSDEGSIRIELRGTNNELVFCNYSSRTTPTATTLSVGLNKANLSLAYANNATTGSLRQRILHRLAVMGESAQVCNKTITGTVTGNPQ